MGLNTLAHRFETAICGRDFIFTRSLDLLRRVEATVGPLAPFARRLESGGCTSLEIARLYSALLRDIAGGPTSREIDDWVFSAGTRHTEMALFLVTLTFSSDELERVTRHAHAQGQAPASPEAGDTPRGPFFRAA